jgi:ribonuclease HII
MLAFDLVIGARTGACLVAGADEVGRACLAGPLVAAACLFDWNALTPAELVRLERLRDSKDLKPARCRELRTAITELAVCVEVCVVNPAEIDRDGLHDSNLRALRETVSRLKPTPRVCFTDGFAVPDTRYSTIELVRGDETSAAVAAASVVAKAKRDELMEKVIADHPDYGFERHQGYITEEHNDAIRRLGVITGLHRMSYDCAIYRELAAAGFCERCVASVESRRCEAACDPLRRCRTPATSL